MQQEIKLTNESSNTVFVDDVDVSKGVYAKDEHGSTFYVGICQNGFYSTQTNDFVEYDIKEYNTRASLKEFISSFKSCNYFTIPDNKRIVTEREVTIEDLKSTDHIGFVTNNGEKGHIVYYDGKLQLISTIGPSMAFCNNTYGSDAGSTMADAILKNTSSKKVDKVYRFTERTGEGSLYEWLNKK